MYRRHSIKKRALRFFKAHKPKKIESYAQWKQQLVIKLRSLIRQKYSIIYLDETMFTRSTMRSVEYCHKGANMLVDEARLNEPTLALLIGVS